MFETPYAEMLVAFSCPLHCDGCQNYTNYSLKGLVELEDGSAQIRGWSARIKPKMFRLLGGEPLLHHQLGEYIRVAAEAWPQARRVVVTNGLLAERREDILPALLETGTEMELSIHSNDPKYMERLRPAVTVLKRWAGRGVTITICDSRDFIRTYRGIGVNMRPFNHDPAKAWSICTARTCLNIYQGRLWKCPTIAMLKAPLEKFGLTEHPDWKPHLAYGGLSPDSSDDELREFLSRGPESICSICPATRETYQKDVFNLDFKRQGDRAEVSFPVVDLKSFLADC